MSPSIISTLDEAVLISSNDVQPQKTAEYIFLMCEWITQDFNDVQCAKDEGEIKLTLLGISILINEEHPLNAPKKICFKSEGNFISFKLLQP